MNLDEIMKMRKRQAAILKVINKLNIEFESLRLGIKAVETGCSHEWSSRAYSPKTDLFKRSCQKCGVDDYRKD